MRLRLLLTDPTTTLVRIKAITADAASITASAARKLKNTTVMMFLSMPKFLGPAAQGTGVECVKMLRGYPAQRGRG